MRVEGEKMEMLSETDLASAQLREQQIYQDVHREPLFRSFHFHFHSHRESPASETQTETDTESIKQTGRQKTVLREKDKMLPPPAPAPKKARRLN